ncbi:MAG: hypothetical protein IJH17_04225, partial [Clostridia bacterium]|nr:hypothetical protein [Clostridia bacterium]
ERDATGSVTSFRPVAGSMAPVFDPSIHTYYVTVPYEVDTMNFETEAIMTQWLTDEQAGETPVVTATSSTAVVTTNYDATGKADGTFTVNPPEGEDATVVFYVYPSTDANYPTGSYAVVINRRTHETIKSIDLREDDPDTVADESGIVVTDSSGDPVALTTEFRQRDVNYYAYIDSAETEVTVTANADFTGTPVKVNGVLHTNTIQTPNNVTTVIIESGLNEAAKQRYSLTLIKKNSTTKLTSLDADGVALTLGSEYSQTYLKDYTTLTPVPTYPYGYSMPLDLSATGSDYVVRVNGRRVDPSTLGISELINTDREKYDIRSTSKNDVVTAASGGAAANLEGTDTDSYVYTLFVNTDKDEDEYEAVFTDLIVKDSSGIGFFDHEKTGSVHTYNVMVDDSDIEMFATRLANSLPDNKVKIELFDIYKGSDATLVRDEYMNDYTVTTMYNSYIPIKIDDSNVGKYKFRLTTYGDSGFENVTEYILNVYKTHDPILTELRVSPKPNDADATSDRHAVMAEQFIATEYGDYHVYIGKDVTNFDVITESFTGVGIQIGLVTSFDADGNPLTVDYNTPAATTPYTKTISDLSTSEDHFTVLVRVNTIKMLENNIPDPREAVYTLQVIRAPFDKSDKYLMNLEVVEETDSNDGLYELSPNFNELIRLYETTIDYTDYDVKVNISKQTDT